MYSSILNCFNYRAVYNNWPIGGRNVSRFLNLVWPTFVIPPNTVIFGRYTSKFEYSLFIFRVEFALKLGYTEKHVQAALQKLGPSPTQNELLAELIKLGAQKRGSCDSSPTESLVSDLGLLDRYEYFT